MQSGPKPSRHCILPLPSMRYSPRRKQSGVSSRPFRWAVSTAGAANMTRQHQSTSRYRTTAPSCSSGRVRMTPDRLFSSRCSSTRRENCPPSAGPSTRSNRRHHRVNCANRRAGPTRNGSSVYKRCSSRRVSLIVVRTSTLLSRHLADRPTFATSPTPLR